MSPLQVPHATGRSLQTRHGESNCNVTFEMDNLCLPSLPPQVHDPLDPRLLTHRPHAAMCVEKWEDDCNMSLDALEQALAAMRRDQYFYAAQEQQHAKERRDSRLMEPATVRKPLPPKRKKKNIVAATRDSKPALQSHAATHPSLYHQPPTEADARMPFPQLPMKPVDVGLDHAHQKSQSLVKRWQTYSDPKASTSAAMCDDPRFRLLEIDVDPEEPNVISPGWMVALPFGTLVEAACEYLEGTESD